MTDVESLARDFDHHGPDYAADPWSVNLAFSKRCPVARSEKHGGFWYVTGYDLVRQVALDDETFSARHDLPNGSTPFEGISIPGYPMRAGFIETDPPLALEWRSPFTKLFSPGAVKNWQKAVENVTTWCLDQKIEAGEMDLVLDFCGPVPAIITLKMLGLPLENWKTFSDASHHLVASAPGSPEAEAAMRAHGELFATLPEVARQRREEPRDDLLTLIAGMELEGRPITDELLIETVLLIVQGGVDTTSNLVAHALRYFAENPGERQRVLDDPKLIPSAAEEFLRYYAPVQAIGRTATRDVELGGQLVKAGDRLLISWAGANLDESLWPDADKVILDRATNRHTSFGLGIHRCLGSNIARLMIEVMIAEILERIPDYTLTAQVQRYATIGIIHGIEGLPVRFDSGARRMGPTVTLDEIL
jgi:cytochrome P450